MILSATARNDWSSTLPPENRSFFYPSINAGLIFFNLIANNDFLTFGKIRGSWAKVGRSAPVYKLYDTFDKLNINAPNNQPRAEVSDVQKNIDLRPEISSEFEIGTELKFHSNKIGLDFTYYNKKTDGQIIDIPLTNTTGFSSTVLNAGIVRNKGIEALLTFNNLVTFDDFNWDLGVNFTKNSNVVEELPEEIDEITIATGWWSNTSIRARRGESTGTIYGTVWDRDDNGNIYTVNGTPQRASENDVIGDTQPDFLLNFNGNFDYKSVELGFLFEVKQGGDVDAYNDQVDAYKSAFASETSTSVTLDKIMTEKYKAMFTMNIETWTDLRRHDFAYPSGGYLSLPNEATLPQFIRRGLYPQAEIDNNFDNVPTGISMTDRPWWDRN